MAVCGSSTGIVDGMNRRGFFGAISALLTGAALDPERLLWVPGRKLISIPEPNNLCIRLIQMFDFIVGEQAARFDVATQPMRTPSWCALTAQVVDLTPQRACEEAARFFNDPRFYPSDPVFQQTARQMIRRVAGAQDMQFGVSTFLRGEPPRMDRVVSGPFGHCITGPDPYPPGAAILDPFELSRRDPRFVQVRSSIPAFEGGNDGEERSQTGRR